MKILKVAVALGLATSLSGCLNDSSVADSSLDVAKGLSLYERVGLDDGTNADLDTLPSSATMSGYVAAEISDGGDENRAFLGELNVEANFESGEITGTASNIGYYSYEGECPDVETCEGTQLSALDGDLTLAAEMADSGNTFTGGSLTGALSGDYREEGFNGSDGAFEGQMDTTLELNASGKFLRDREGLLLSGVLNGDVNGTLTNDDDTYEFNEAIDGVFVAAD